MEILSECNLCGQPIALAHGRMVAEDFYSHTGCWNLHYWSHLHMAGPKVLEEWGFTYDGQPDPEYVPDYQEPHEYYSYVVESAIWDALDEAVATWLPGPVWSDNRNELVSGLDGKQWTRAQTQNALESLVHKSCDEWYYARVNGAGYRAGEDAYKFGIGAALYYDREHDRARLQRLRQWYQDLTEPREEERDNT